MTYSCTIWIPSNDTQWKKLQSLQRPANFIIKSTVTLIGSFLNHDIYMLVKRCLQNEFNLATFNNYFEIFYHKMNTRNNNHSITFPRVKHELARQGFFFAGRILYNSMPLELQQAVDVLLFKRRLKEHFQQGFCLSCFFCSLLVIIALILPVLWFKWISTSSKLFSLLFWKCRQLLAFFISVLKQVYSQSCNLSFVAL